jgi:hypothetical protein
MNHLTTIEVLQIVDETTANGVRTKILAHLEVCPRCRQEVELQRRLLRVAKSTPLVRPSAQLKTRVLDAIDPRARPTFVTRIVNNLGSILAMGMVLTVVWYVASNPAATGGTRQPSMFSDAVKAYVEYYTRARDIVVHEKVRLIGEPAKNHPAKNDDIVLMTVFSVLILVAVDRLVVRRFIKIRL